MSLKEGGSKLQSVEDDDIDETYFISDGDGSKKTRAKKLPAWLDHFNAKDLKVLFKCSLAVWIMTLFIFINPTFQVLGQATFFGCVVLFIQPPSGVVFIQLLVALTLILGLSLGWAWSVITSKAALAARPAADLAARYAALQEIATNTTNIDAATGQSTFTQIQIFEGFMLDGRVTAVYFCMLAVFIYFMARLRVAAPKLTLVSIFSMVVADIYLVIAPLVPTFQGTIAKQMVLPCSVAVGIGVVCNLFVFPRSTSQIVMDGFLDVLAPMKGFIDALQYHMKHPDTRMDLERLMKTKAQVAGAYKALEASTKFLPMDVAVGRFGPKDIASLEDPLREVMVAFSELLQLQIAREQGKNKDEELLAMEDVLYDEKHEEHHQVGHHQISRALDLRSKNRHPQTEDLLGETLQGLEAAASSLMQVTAHSLTAIKEALSGSAVKSKDPKEPSSLHLELLARLEKTKAEFPDLAFRNMFQPHAHYFDEDGHVKAHPDSNVPPPLTGLMIGVLFQERILNLSTSLTALLDKVVSLESERRTIRVWAPLHLGKLFSWGLDQEDVPSGVSAGSNELRRTTTAATQASKKERKGLFGKKPKGEVIVDRTTAKARLESMHRPTGRTRSKAANVTLAVVHWLGNTEGLFALRVVIVTVALSIPAVVPSTAGFFYREKGMWAVVMAQLGLVPYASDFVSGLLVRGLGTAAGGIIGLLAWYIGAGSGPGNPYGMAAIMAVFIVLLMWWRLFAPPEQMAAGIMLSATMYMVVSFSWIDTHIPSYGNPGVGYNIVWRRILLVLIGFAGATIVMFVPKPPSGSRHTRHLLSDHLDGIKDRYALFVSTWRDPPSDLVEVAEKEAIAAGEVLVPLDEAIKVLKYEFSTSNFDSKTLSQVLHLIISLNQDITQLLVYTSRLEPELRDSFVKNTGVVDESLIAEVMSVITLVQQVLRSGDPLPAVMPTPLLGRSFIVSRGTRAEHGTSINAGKLLAEESGRRYVSAVRAFVHMLSAIDEMVIVVKRAVGETSDIDLERL